MTDELRLERVIDAPPDVVFEAFTTDGGQVAFYGHRRPGVDRGVATATCAWAASGRSRSAPRRTTCTTTGASSRSSTVRGGIVLATTERPP